MSSKHSLKRQQAIKELLNETTISNQKRFVSLLKEKFGIETNQSILSRDLRNLGVIKKEVNQQMVYALPEIDVTIELLKLAIVEVKYNETLIVIKTHPGLAAFVGDYIDNESHLEILGCLAGENVVFIACQSIHDIKKTYQAICQKLRFKNNQ
jgi:transcriptional regulator of arginine metabolism